MLDLSADVCALTAEVERLRAENGKLRAALKAPPYNYPTLGLTTMEARCLVALHEFAPNIVSPTEMRDRLYGVGADIEATSKVIDVYLCRIRRKLTGVDITIHNARGQGWWIDETGRARLDDCTLAGEV